MPFIKGNSTLHPWGHHHCMYICMWLRTTCLFYCTALEQGLQISTSELCPAESAGVTELTHDQHVLLVVLCQIIHLYIHSPLIHLCSSPVSYASSPLKTYLYNQVTLVGKTNSFTPHSFLWLIDRLIVRQTDRLSSNGQVCSKSPTWRSSQITKRQQSKKAENTANEPRSSKRSPQSWSKYEILRSQWENDGVLWKSQMKCPQIIRAQLVVNIFSSAEWLHSQVHHSR